MFLLDIAWLCARSAGSVTLVTRGLELPDRGHFSDGFHPRSLVVAEADHAVPRHSHDSTPLWLPADGSKNGTCWPWTVGPGSLKPDVPGLSTYHFFGCWCSSRLYTVFSSNWVINPDQGFYIISGSDSHCVRNFQGCSWWRRTNQCAHPAGNVAYLEALWSMRGGLLCCLWRPGICWNIGFQKLSIFNSRLAVHDSHQLDLDRLRLFSKPGHCRGPIRWCYIAQSSMLKNGKDTKYPRCHVQYHSSPSWKKVGVQEVLSLIMSRV